MENSGPIAILAHWRTGSILLKDILVTCGMKSCEDEFGIQYGDINGVGNTLYHGISTDRVPGEEVAGALKEFKDFAILYGWPHYGIKVDHALQLPCWGVIGEQIEINWPNARYVISIRHPAGVIKSIERLRKTVKLDPDFTVKEIIESYLSTHEATKYLIKEKEALVVVYPDSHADGNIKEVISQLGLVWTDAADALFDKATLDESDDGIDKTQDYIKAVEMFEELKKHATRGIPRNYHISEALPGETLPVEKTVVIEGASKNEGAPTRRAPYVRPMQPGNRGKKSPKKY